MEEVALLCEIQPDNFLVPCLLPQHPLELSTAQNRRSFVLDFKESCGELWRQKPGVNC